MTAPANQRSCGLDEVRPAERAGTTSPPRRTIDHVPTAADRDPDRYLARRARIEVALGWLVPAALIGLWQLAAVSDWIDTRFFPAPSTIASTARELIESGELQDDSLLSLRRVTLGLALGSIAGYIVGVALGLSRLARAAFEPLLSALYTVPKLSLLPLLLLIFGVGETPKVLLIAITVFFFMWIATMSAVMSVAPGHREAIVSFGASRWQQFRHVIFPSSLPQVFVGFRMSTGVAVLVLVGAEFVQGNDGLGHLIWHSWTLFSARKMYVGIVAVALMGVLAMVLVKAVGRRITPWAEEIAESHGQL